MGSKAGAFTFFFVPLHSLPIAGSAPSELGKLEALQHHSLGNNQLTDESILMRTSTF